LPFISFNTLKEHDKVIDNQKDLQDALVQAGKVKNQDEEVDDLKFVSFL